MAGHFISIKNQYIYSIVYRFYGRFVLVFWRTNLARTYICHIMLYFMNIVLYIVSHSTPRGGGPLYFDLKSIHLFNKLPLLWKIRPCTHKYLQSMCIVIQSRTLQGFINRNNNYNRHPNSEVNILKVIISSLLQNCNF